MPSAAPPGRGQRPGQYTRRPKPPAPLFERVEIDPDRQLYFDERGNCFDDPEMTIFSGLLIVRVVVEEIDDSLPDPDPYDDESDH
jgi:hypothetical protein